MHGLVNFGSAIQFFDLLPLFMKVMKMRSVKYEYLAETLESLFPQSNQIDQYSQNSQNNEPVKVKTSSVSTHES